MLAKEADQGLRQLPFVKTFAAFGCDTAQRFSQRGILENVPDLWPFPMGQVGFAIARLLKERLSDP